MDKGISFYVHAFSKLRRGNEDAPHKPILLLSVINLYEAGLVESNRIYITPILVAFFRDNWLALVKTEHAQRFPLPFFHLNNEKSNFWHLIPNAGSEVWLASKTAIRNFEALKKAVAYAQIDFELHHFLQQEETRDIFKITLLETYFPDRSSNSIGGLGGFYTNEIKHQILTDSSEQYAKRNEWLQKTMSADEFLEDRFVRSGFFKRTVPEVYQNTCCISGLRIDATTEVALIDACHIIPFSISQNDTISNGICLCPNLHRAFDRGLITVNDRYEVVVSNSFIESNSSYSIRQFEGKKILLPDQQAFLPKIENFWWHQKNVFKK